MVHEHPSEPLDDLLGEVPREVLFEVLGVGEVGIQEVALDRALRIGDQERDLRPREPHAPTSPLRHLVGRREELDGTVQLALGLELEHQVLARLVPLGRDGDLLGEDLRLEVVVVEHPTDDVVRAGLQQGVAVVGGELAALDREAEQDLQVHLAVGGVDARRVVDEVGVDPATRERVLDPPRCVKPRLPPSPTTRARTWLPLMRTGSFARSPTSVWPSFVAFTYVPMPPFQSRSTGACSTHRITSAGRHLRGRVVGDREGLPRLRRTASPTSRARSITSAPSESTDRS